ncbi:MAG TPA: YwmB family TATA-box binding protein [Capillibacterium sp.]
MFRSFLRKILFSLCFLFLFTMRYVDQTFSVALNDHPLLAGWEGIGVPLTEIQIEGWKKLNSEFMASSDLLKIAAGVEQRLKLKRVAPPLVGDELDFSYLTLEGTLDDQVRVVLTFQSIRGEANLAESFCGVIALPGTKEMLTETMLRLKRALEPALGEFPLAVMLGGVKPGRLTEGEAYQLMKGAFHQLQVTGGNGGFELNSGRWSAWSNLLDGKVIREGRQINLEFGYRYLETEGVTRIILASPTLPGYF